MSRFIRFRHRTDAGQRLAWKLRAYSDRPDVVVLALPRGGVPVAREVAHQLRAPLDIFLVRKLGVPGARELAMGAIAENGRYLLDDRIVALEGVSDGEIQEVIRQEREELQRRAQQYRGSQSSLPLAGRIVILVDDGLATGATMRAAIDAVRAQQPARVVVAVPVASASAARALRAEVDDWVCVLETDEFYAVSQWYENFGQVTDEEVLALLKEAHERGDGTDIKCA